MTKLFSSSSMYLVRSLYLFSVLLVLVETPDIARSQSSGIIPPTLISETASTRAIALNSVTLTREPFALTTPTMGGTDPRTRVTLFAMNLAGAELSALTADAEDQAGRHYPLRVEFLGPIAVSQQWVTQVILRLSDDLGDVGDVLVRVTNLGLSSNRVRIGIGHLGGGPPDDAGAIPTPGPPYLSALPFVLEFDGSPQTVDYGDFFQLQPGQTQLGNFFWEVWAMPGTDALARYMISDGYGGAHAILFGFVGDSNGTRYSLYGNVWNGTTAIDFGSDDGPAPNEWGHYAVGWDGSYIYTYFNGVPVGLKPFSGPRMPAGSDNGGGELFIGGSDHNNFMGRIAQVRGFENSNPRANGLQALSFRPDTVFGLAPGTHASPRSSFLTNFFRPAPVVPDLAGGRAGVLRGTAFGAINPISSYPLPQFVVDPNAPNTSTIRGPVAPSGLVDTPAPVPANAIIFDSFSRQTSTYAFNGRGGLGSTEGGSAGIKEWKTSGTGGNATTVNVNESFGIVNGRAVVLSDSVYGCLAWVETGATTGYLRTSVSRDPRFYKSGIDTGISFRVADASNYFFAFTYGDPLNASPRKLIVGYWLKSQINYLVESVPIPGDWRKLQVVTTSAGNIDVYADSILVYSTTSNILATATGVGLFNFVDYYALANRWDNFTVYDRP